MSTAESPLAGLRVVERSSTVAGAYAGRLLATLGAETVVVEPTQGHRLRRHAPVLPNGTSSLFTYLAVGKRSIACDVNTEAGRDELASLIDHADVYLDDGDPRGRVSAGVTPAETLAQRPSLVYVSVRPFGATGPKNAWAGEEVNLMAASGEAYLLPNGLAYETHPGRAPLKIAGSFAGYQGGVAAALGALAALWSGTGQLVDISVQDAAVAVGAFGIQRYGDGSLEHRSTRTFRYGGVLECSDGYVELLTLEDRQWQGLVDLLGHPAWAEEFSDAIERGNRGDEINAHLRAWAHGHTTAEIVAGAQERGVPAATYATPADVLADAHERARGLFQEIEVPGLGGVPVLVAPFQVDHAPLRLADGPPPPRLPGTAAVPRHVSRAEVQQ